MAKGTRFPVTAKCVLSLRPWTQAKSWTTWNSTVMHHINVNFIQMYPYTFAPVVTDLYITNNDLISIRNDVCIVLWSDLGVRSFYYAALYCCPSSRVRIPNGITAPLPLPFLLNVLLSASESYISDFIQLEHQLPLFVPAGTLNLIRPSVSPSVVTKTLTLAIIFALL